MKNRSGKLALVAPASVDSLGPAFDPALAQELLKLQAAQWQMMMGWQDAMLAIYRDWWDGWACRWTGGVRIDG